MKDRTDISGILRLVDWIELPICAYIHDIVSGTVFSECTGSDFVNFVNLKPTASPIKRADNKKLQASYLIYRLMGTIRGPEYQTRWRDEFLKICKIDFKYYDSHKKDFEKEDRTTDENKAFKKRVDQAIRMGLYRPLPDEDC